MMTLERYSHVMHMTSQVSGRLRADKTRHRRAAGDAARRHRVRCAQGAGHGDHRRPRAHQARPLRRASSATSTSRATSTPPSPSAPWSSAMTGGPRCRPARASWPTACPSTRTSSATTRPAPSWPPIPAARRMTALRRAGRDERRRSAPVASRSHGRPTRSAHHARRRADPARRGAGARSRGARLPAGPAQPGRGRAGGGRVGTVAAPAAHRQGRRVAPGHAARRRRACSSTSMRVTARRWHARLRRFKLRTKAELEAVDLVRPRPAGPGCRRRRMPSGALGLAAGWPGVDGRRPARRRRARPRPGCRWSTRSALEALRIECGVPAMGAELTDGHHPGRGGSVAHRRVGQLHQGLLHGPGAGGPHRQPRRQRAPPGARPPRRRLSVAPVGATVQVDGSRSARSPRRSGRRRSARSRSPSSVALRQSARCVRVSLGGRSAPTPRSRSCRCGEGRSCCILAGVLLAAACTGKDANPTPRPDPSATDPPRSIAAASRWPGARTTTTTDRRDGHGHDHGPRARSGRGRARGNGAHRAPRRRQGGPHELPTAPTAATSVAACRGAATASGPSWPRRWRRPKPRGALPHRRAGAHASTWSSSSSPGSSSGPTWRRSPRC